MQRFHQILFVMSLLATSWFAMMAVHELGHVVGALLTGGHVKCVVLHPLSISRTDVSPNPNPTVVVWSGPIIGCFLPWTAALLIPNRKTTMRNIAAFFAGFCLLANGAYIAIGSIDSVGDCGEMLRTGTPVWLMVAFGAVTIPAGLFQWHRLGSLKKFLYDPAVIKAQDAYMAFGFLIAVVIAELLLSPFS